MRLSLAVAPFLVCLVGDFAPAALARQGAAALVQPDQERFSTGPIQGPPPGLLPGSSLPNLEVQPAPPDGGDKKANTTTTNMQNETSMAVNPLDALNWVAVANDYKTGNVQIGWYTTKNGGQSWTTGGFGIQPGFSFSGDPCVCFDQNGTAHAIGMQYFGPGGSAVVEYRSADGGLTWDSGHLINLHGANDKPQVECNLSQVPGAAFYGDILVAWDRFADSIGGDNEYISVLLAGTGTWTPIKKINDTPVSSTGIAPDVAYGPNGEVYVAWADRAFNKFDAYVDRSFDGGTTWNADVKVADYVAVPSPIPGSVFRMFDIFAISADATTGPYSGRVYVAYHTWVTGAPNHADIRCATSIDQGATWTQNVLVNADDTTANDQVMPGICVDSKGNVNVSYFDRRLDPNNFLLWEWVSRSSDGGATFKDVRASDVGWNHIPTENSGFIGDYQDVDCSAQRVHPCWTDGRSGSQDVYTESLNLDLYTDVSSISSATGGTAAFTINVGPNHGGELYLVCASGSGTAPGLILDGVPIPLNVDAWTTALLSLANTPVFPGAIGTLDATGSASALFVAAPFSSTLAGTALDFSAISVSLSLFEVTYATAATRVNLVL